MLHFCILVCMAFTSLNELLHLLLWLKDAFLCGFLGRASEGLQMLVLATGTYQYFLLCQESSITMIVKYQRVLSSTFTLNFFLAIDLWKVFIKVKLNQYSVTLFGTWSHILEVSGTLSQVLRGTFYLRHRMILSDGRLLFFSIIVKFLLF